jgi:hypothetical protein
MRRYKRGPRNLFYFWIPHPPTWYCCVHGYSGTLVIAEQVRPTFAPVVVLSRLLCVCAGVHRAPQQPLASRCQSLLATINSKTQNGAQLTLACLADGIHFGHLLPAVPRPQALPMPATALVLHMQQQGRKYAGSNRPVRPGKQRPTPRLIGTCERQARGFLGARAALLGL